jgi:hypothetical protein
MRLKKVNLWIESVLQARDELNITNFQVVKKGNKLYRLAKKIHMQKKRQQKQQLQSRRRGGGGEGGDQDNGMFSFAKVAAYKKMGQILESNKPDIERYVRINMDKLKPLIKEGANKIPDMVAVIVASLPIPGTSATIPFIKLALESIIRYLLPSVINQVDEFPSLFMKEVDVAIRNLKDGRQPDFFKD